MAQHGDLVMEWQVVRRNMPGEGQATGREQSLGARRVHADVARGAKAGALQYASMQDLPRAPLLHVSLSEAWHSVGVKCSICCTS